MLSGLVVGAVLIALAYLGLRRGLARELASALSWSGATWAALVWAPALAPRAAGWLGVAALPGYAAALVGLWAAVYLALWAIFRAMFWRLWRPLPGARGEGGGEGAERATLGERGARLVDSLLGGAVGALKGAIVCGVVLYAGDLPVPGAARAPWLARAYQGALAPALDRLPEVRFARAAGALVRVRAALREHPERRERLTEHPELVALADHPSIARALADKDLRADVAARRIEEVVQSPRLVELLRDGEALERVAAVDATRVLDDVLRDAPPAWMFPAPPSAAPGPLEPGDEVRARVTHVEGYGAVARVLDDEGRPLVAAAPASAAEDGAAGGAAPAGGVAGEGPVEGLIRPEDLSWTRTYAHPREALAPGAEVTAVVLATGLDPRRVALGLKQASGDPWDFKIPFRFPARRAVEGEVVRVVAGEGAYVLLEREVEGLIPEEQLRAAGPLPIGGRVAARVRHVVRSRRVLLLDLEPR